MIYLFTITVTDDGEPFEESVYCNFEEDTHGVSLMCSLWEWCFDADSIDEVEERLKERYTNVERSDITFDTFEEYDASVSVCLGRY